MDGRGIRHIQSLTRARLLLAVALQLSACGPGDSPVSAAAGLGVDPAAVVDIGTSGVAPMIESDGRVAIVAIRVENGEWVATPITASPGRAGTDSLHLVSYAGATGEDWNTFVFGTATPGTERVELAGFPDQRGGRVVDGAWIIALREQDVGPQDLEWLFVADDGSVRTGVGIFPPDA
jgi:hypothetical protein